MPFKSAKQRRALFANPKTRPMAKRWAKKYGAKVGGGKARRQKKKS